VCAQQTRRSSAGCWSLTQGRERSRSLSSGWRIGNRWLHSAGSANTSNFAHPVLVGSALRSRLVLQRVHPNETMMFGENREGWPGGGRFPLPRSCSLPQRERPGNSPVGGVGCKLHHHRWRTARSGRKVRKPATIQTARQAGRRAGGLPPTSRRQSSDWRGWCWDCQSSAG